MSKEYLEALEPSVVLKFVDDLLKRYEGKTDYNIYITKDWLLEIKQSLHRLEAIDNANPSEALEYLEEIKNYFPFVDLGKGKEYVCEKEFNTIKQALLKAEKEHNSVNLLMQELDCKDFAELRKYARCGYEKLNKQYLKWEDLEFKHKPVFTEAKMGETIYKLVIGFDCTGKETIFLRTDNQQIVFHEKDKQLFNDLHLERVE